MTPQPAEPDRGTGAAPAPGGRPVLPDVEAAAVVLVTGAPGTGKTSLLRSPAGPGVTALSATCTEADAGVEFAAARQLLPAQPRAGAQPAPADGGHRTVLDLYRRALGLLQFGPVRLVLDDAHWCDPATLRWLQYLLRRCTSRPLQVVLAVTPREHPALDPLFADILGSPRHLVLDLDAPEHAGAQPGTGRLRRLLSRQPNLLRVAVAAAVLQRHDAELVGALAGLSPQLTVARLATLRNTGVLTGDPDRPVPPGVAAELFALLAPDELQRLRRRAAVMLDDADAPVRRVADVLVDLDDLDEPWMPQRLREAAALAYRHDAPAAVRIWTRLLAARPQSPDAAVDVAFALLNVDPAAALTHARQALPRTADARTKARAVVCLGLAALVTGREPTAPYLLHDAMETLRRAAGTAPTLQDRIQLATVESTLAANAVINGATYHTVRSRIGDAPAGVAGASSNHRMLAVHALATAYEGLDVERATRYARMVLDRPVTGDSWAPLMATRVLLMADDTAGALAAASRLAAHHHERGEPCAEAVARATWARVLLEVGELEAAWAEATAALRLAGDAEWGAATWSAQTIISLINSSQARILAAEAGLEAMQERTSDMPLWEQVQAMGAGALAAYWGQDHDRALQRLRVCGQLIDDAGVCSPAFSSWWLDEIILLTVRGRAQEAHLRLEQVEEQCRRWPTPRTSGMALLARAALAEDGARVELLLGAIAELERSPAPLHQVKAQLMLGRTLTVLGDRTAARRHLRDGMVLSNRLGYTMLAAHCRNVLSSAGGRTGTQLAACGELSSSERAVASLAAGGATNRQIAEELFISMRTVEFHLTNVYRRLGIRRRDALAGIVEPTPLTRRGAAAARPPRPAPGVVAEPAGGAS
ncbi:helix-turn-helix domain-containing protein [Dactylosporangium aurantiacum]|uniref:Helix-turn-helix domain-containing protein n=1 Tax=Dactylosporangium aurantiacum TaxID=35754 RepID=A0A9Q9ID45_9ACTN|nr:LuxR family transcriptional regulator [Dactylosporangium aurantiacum]MDG6106847.1 LuxR family transcriptional regulator [Dactylosporangium aurantiacum]UWZ50983.1 helix-turn-helix domain-containing protein [Dactylosporangium aurantiacum]